MKALRITGYGKLENNLVFQQLDKPEPGEDQVLVEVCAASVNPIDFKIVEGALKPVNKLQFPAPIGFDVAGRIVDKGPNVQELRIGDEVFARVPTLAPGTFAEYIAVASEVVIPKPGNLDFNAAAGIPLVGLTTVQSFNKAHLKAGDKVLIHAGSGGVGSFAIQYAKARGAYVYTTTSTQNREWVKELGADRVIDYTKENYLEVVADLDIVYDTLGGAYTLDAFKSIKKGGTVVSIAGELDAETARDLGLNRILRFLLALKRWKISKRAQAKAAHYKFILMEPDARQLEDLKTLLQQGAIQPVIDMVYPFSKAIEALRYQKAGRARGKVIINMETKAQ